MCKEKDRKVFLTKLNWRIRTQKMIQGGSSTDLLQMHALNIHTYRTVYVWGACLSSWKFWLGSFTEETNNKRNKFMPWRDRESWQTAGPITACRLSPFQSTWWQTWRPKLCVWRLVSDKHKAVKPSQSLSQHRQLYLWRKINFMISARDKTIDRPARGLGSLFLKSVRSR